MLVLMHLQAVKEAFNVSEQKQDKLKQWLRRSTSDLDDANGRIQVWSAPCQLFTTVQQCVTHNCMAVEATPCYDASTVTYITTHNLSCS